MSNSDVKMYMKQLLNALSYMEERKIMHRDIKPDNIMIKSIEN